MKKEINNLEINYKKLNFFSLDKNKWQDFETLMGERGGCGGCWCMAWRLNAAEFKKSKGEGNKKLMKSIINKNEPAGIIAYQNDEPIGWCAFAPREKYKRLEKSRVLKPIDDNPVWSITCFFIKKEFRRKGLSTELLKNVIAYCKKNKIRILEGYPVVPYNNNIPAAFAWMGIPSAFEKAGFEIAARRSKSRPIMRYYL